MEATTHSLGRFKKYPRPLEEDYKKYIKGHENSQKNFEENISNNNIEESPSNCWERDVKRIINSLSFRRLQYKTQVFLNPSGDHYSDRMRHTLSVMNISTQIAKKYNFNIDLTKAIALAHDIGHSPYGHAGERAINDLLKKHSNRKLFFNHTVQGARMLLYLEYDSRYALLLEERENEEYGIGPTLEVINGILNHSNTYNQKIEKNIEVDRWKKLEEIVGKPVKNITIEGECVRISDKVSQCIHDLADAKQSNYINKNDLVNEIFEPKKSFSQFGEELEDYFIDNVVVDGKLLKLTEEGNEKIKQYKSLMERRVYGRSEIIKADNRGYNVISKIFNYLIEEEDILEKIRNGEEKYKKKHLIHRNIFEQKWLYGFEDWSRIVANYIASMTDRYLDNLYNDLFY